MQRIKKSIVWLLLMVLVGSLFPAGLTQQAMAAGNDLTSTTYFSPDILDIRKTSNLDLTKENLRDEVYITNNPTISISGTYSKVSGDTLRAQVDLFTWDAAKKSWITDKVHSAPGTVQKDSNTPESRFVASNLTLFPGLNRITFTGTIGNLEGSESFYVLYDKIPFVSKLVISGGGLLSDVNLNEGTRVVVENSPISLLGEVHNTTKATVSVNGGAPLSTEIYNNQLATPPLNLVPGLNKLKIVFTNASDSITITRDVYYFKQSDPFTDMYVMDGNQEYKVFENRPSLTTTGLTQAQMIVQVLLPFTASDKDFVADSKITVGGQDVTIAEILDSNLYSDSGSFNPKAGSEVVITGSGGNPSYRLVTFRTSAFNLETENGAVKTTQSPRVIVNYGANGSAWNFTASYTPTFQYLSGQVLITDMKYLPDYKDSYGGKLDNVSQTKLDGAQVSNGDFYIMVKTSGTPDGSLTGEYLPLGTKTLNITRMSEVEGMTNTWIYKITGFSNGEQQVRFKYDNSSPVTVKISYVSKNYIYISNLFDGQTYTFNSKLAANEMNITGEYIGFENLTNSQYFINGISGENLKDGIDGTDIKLDVDLTANPKQTKFSLTLFIKPEGPLVYGENSIVFTGTSMDNAGNKREVRKELRIYIVDENISNISQFHPAKVPATGKSRAPFPTKEQFESPDTDVKELVKEMIAKIFEHPAEFTFKDDKYTTSEQEYDLVIRGGGARYVNLYFGSDKIFTVPLDIETKHEIATYQGYNYDLTGNENDFILRIRNFKFESPGTHVYNLELVNSTGARTNQRLEITRELAPYRLLAPQPTVGDKYVVNKNFIRFDIEAEGATKVVIDKGEATRRPEPEMKDRFTYDYVGLKPNKATKIKIQIVRGDATINDTIEVFYTGTVEIDSQFMAEKVSNKYSIFNKSLELSFPKGTVLQSANMNSNRVTKFYPDNKILFGIADPKDGVVERRNDYGGFINKNDGINNIIIPDTYISRFNSTVDTSNFTRISQIYWISGGVGELGDKGNIGYKASTNGLAPYSTEGFFTAFENERKIVPSQRGTLTLSYDPNVVDQAGTLVTVFRYVDAGGFGRWERVPGSVNSSKHTITVPFDEFGYYTVMKLNRGYSDITNHPWARNILNGLYSKGIMEALRADAFGADDQTTRGEFATLLVKGLNIPINADENQQTFFDVPYGSKTSTWDFEHLETAARAGIITGRTEGFFSPNMPITRQDAAVMISRAMKSLKLPANDQKLKDNLAKSFLDSGKMDYYALPSISAVTKAKIMSGTPVTLPGAKKPSYNFNPDSNMTRAEAGKIVVELFKKTTNIFPKNFS
ncbi:S-layer homology domain-containing protein [Paenibacillus aceti]|uniref:SLH domain-containing protein n=1 Tax=Paenibacillus aceti TaxID=1820010 RepID=A0ABQ1VUG5_9BACL|nr:S-layer homology domain-containing protein [Paenibacillus aceti]GGF96271.1 hypothetical protein GCM10010913_17340 [Paenibacillus aceti]